MKLKLISILCTTLLTTTSVLADNHSFDRQTFQLGVERLDITINEKFKVDGNNFLGATYGYKFTPHFGIELKALLPLNNKQTSVTVDTFRDWNDNGNLTPEAFGEIESTSYENVFEHNVMGNISLVLDLPLQDHFSVYANVGYSTGSVDYVAYDFNDNVPAVDLESAINSGANLCQITGIEKGDSFCDRNLENSIVSVTSDGSGFSYGFGIRFSFISNDNISIGYNSYLNTSDLDISGLSVNYQWNF